MDPIKDFLLKYLMPEKCYDEFFLNFNLFYAPCLRIVLSKTLGIWIILGSVMGRLPQVFKLLWTKNAHGLSSHSILLEVYATTVVVADCIVRNFPLSAWAEILFMLIQTLAIGFLVQYYKGNSLRGLGFLVVYGSLVSFLVSSLTPRSVVTTMRALSIPAIIVGQARDEVLLPRYLTHCCHSSVWFLQLFQAGTNYHNGHTGQLSAVSVFLLFAGSLARVLASKLENGDSLTILSHASIACCYGLIGCQVLHSWNSSSVVKQKKKQ